MNDSFNKSLIRGHEGLRLTVYRDTKGITTIGVGFNLRANAAVSICTMCGVDYAAICAGSPLTLPQANAIFELQYAAVARFGRLIFPAIDTYPQNAAAVICDMLFQLGYAGFMEFQHAIAAARAGNWTGFAAEIKHSALAAQAPHRVENNVLLLESI
ncbi:MAG: hypothetical protein M3O02_11250 [Acidobacteriota bacterium]|nr:hypothetical protein [Acidobacteriota bacterium]